MHLITINHQLIKAYPHIEQCWAWVVMNGYVSEGRGRKFLDERVRVYSDLEQSEGVG